VIFRGSERRVNFFEFIEGFEALIEVYHTCDGYISQRINYNVLGLY
jgi:hypothetical protein